MNREIGDIYVPRAVPVGTKIWFSSERNGYTVDNLACAEQTPLHAVLKLAIVMAEKGIL